MAKQTNTFTKKVIQFFEQRPEREFMFATISAADRRAAAELGWPFFGNPDVDLSGKRVSPAGGVSTALIHRADPMAGLTTPGVLFFPQGMPLPPFENFNNDPSARDREEEAMGNFMWAVAVGGTPQVVIDETTRYGRTVGRL